MLRLLPLVLATFAAVALPRLAHAQCSSDGAVALPNGWDISLPFEEGENVRVLSGYGPEGGSSLHCRSTSTTSANDYYALDLVLPDHPDSGKGRPVLAIADGVVLDADWGSEGWANYGRRVYVRHTIDGETYTTMYAHLNSMDVSNGQQVTKGQRLGTLGGSCQGADACASFSTPHLHFAIHRGASFGGSGSGGSYGGRAVIPEPIDGYTGIQRNQTLVSQNGAEPEPPPPMCDVVIGTDPVTLEEDGPCTQRMGTLTDLADGSGGHAFYAPLSHPSPDYAAGAIYQLQFAAPGTYELRVAIPAGVPNQAPEATYKISFAGGASENVVLDQSAFAGGEAVLGRWDFDDVSSQWVRVGDNYDDAANEGKNFAMDALVVAPALPCVCATNGELDVEPCPEGGQRARTCDGCDYGEWGACTTEPIDQPTNNTVGNTNNAGGTTGTTGPSGPEDETDDGDGPGVISATGGCGCASAPAMEGSLLVMLLGLFGVGRRRRG